MAAMSEVFRDTWRLGKLPADESNRIGDGHERPRRIADRVIPRRVAPLQSRFRFTRHSQDNSPFLWTSQQSLKKPDRWQFDQPLKSPKSRRTRLSVKKPRCVGLWLTNINSSDWHTKSRPNGASEMAKGPCNCRRAHHDDNEGDE